MTEQVPEIRSRCKENDTCLAEHEDASSGSLKTSPQVFSSDVEFYVWSDEGINLFVDLNSSHLDWTENFKNEVYICESVYRDKCLQKNLSWFKGHKGIASSFQWSNHAGLLKGDYLLKETPSSSTLMTNSGMEIGQPDEAVGSVIVSAVTSHAIEADASEKIDEDQRVVSSGTDIDVQNQKLDGSEFCAAEDDCVVNLDLDNNDALPNKEVRDSISGGPSNLATLEYQNSMAESEICETSTLQNSCSMLNLLVENPGSSAVGSMDIQSSDVEQCPKDVSCSPCRALPECSKNVSDYNLPTFAEKSVRCSQSPESLEKTLPVSHILESDGAHKRKRKLIENETMCHYSEPDRRILRSATKAKRVLPRRSGRLILKTVSS